MRTAPWCFPSLGVSGLYMGFVHGAQNPCGFLRLSLHLSAPRLRPDGFVALRPAGPGTVDTRAGERPQGAGEGGKHASCLTSRQAR